MILDNYLNRNFLKYVVFSCAVSVINVIIYLLSYKITKDIIISNIIAYTISFIIAFYINKKVIFKNNNSDILKQIVLFLLIKIMAFVVDSIVLIILSSLFPWDEIILKIIATSSTVFTNYLFNKKLVFKEQR